VFLVLSDVLRDHADGRVVETEEVGDCLKRVLVDAGGCVDPPVTCLLASYLGEELFKTRSGGELLAARNLFQRLVVREQWLELVHELVAVKQDATPQLGPRVDATAASSSAREERILSGRTPLTGRIEAVPRHTEIPDLLAKKICRALSVPQP
jgi:hypothetical protein